MVAILFHFIFKCLDQYEYLFKNMLKNKADINIYTHTHICVYICAYICIYICMERGIIYAEIYFIITLNSIIYIFFFDTMSIEKYSSSLKMF